MDRAAVRPAARVRGPTLDPRADRPRPARDRRRRLGQAAVGRAEPHPGRTCRCTPTASSGRPGIRSSSYALSRCCRCSAGYASMRSSACAPARSAGSNSTRRAATSLQSVCWTCPRTRPGRPSPSPSTVSWARRSKRGRASGRPSPPSPNARHGSWCTYCSPIAAPRWARGTSTRC